MTYEEAYRNYLALNKLADNKVINEQERAEGIGKLREALGLPKDVPADCRHGFQFGMCPSIGCSYCLTPAR